MLENLHIVAIAGGSGTRFWPFSRQHRPKQLLALGGKESLLATTFARVAGLAPPERCWMVVGAAHAEACRAEVPQVAPQRLLVEPQGRNTAPAIALAAAHIMAEDADAVLAVLPADHHVKDGVALCEALARAADAAAQGAIVTLGITPQHPETGYGYIQRGQPDERGAGLFRVRRFCEKPDHQTAVSFLDSGDYLWNAGMFVMRAATFLSELQRQLPVHHAAFAGLREHLRESDYDARLAELYDTIEPISVDYGIMEGAEEISVVPVDCGWSDVGNFAALKKIGEADARGNTTLGKVLTVDSDGCLVSSDDDHLVALLGVSNLAVVRTPDATLVVPLEQSQRVRELVEALQDKNLTEYL